MLVGDAHSIRLASPSVSKWSLTSSIDKEKRTASRSRGGASYHLSFLVTKTEGRWEDGTELAGFDPSFISRLSAVGLGGSDSNFEHTIKVYTPHTNSRQIRFTCGLLYLTFLQNGSVHHFQP